MTLLRPVLAAIAAVLLLAFYAWDKQAAERRIIVAAADDRLFVFDPTQVASIHVRGPGGEFSLERSADGWDITEPRRLRADTAQVDALLGNIGGARRTKPFEAANLADYGLEPARASVELVLSAGSETRRWRLDLGGQRGEAGRVFARVDGTNEVFSVGDWVARQTERRIEEWRDRRLSPGIPVDAPRFTIENPRGRVEFTRDAGKWRMLTGSVEAPADSVMLDSALETLARGRVAVVIDEPTSSTTELGFDKPICTVRAGDRDVLVVGRKLPGKGDFSIRLENGSVGIATLSAVRDFMRGPLDWSSKRFVWHEGSVADEVEIDSGGSAQVRLVWHEGAWHFGGPNADEILDVPVNQGRAATLWRDITSLAALTLVDGPEASPERLRQLGLAPRPALRLRVRFEDGTEQGFDIGSTDTKEGRTHVRRAQDGTIWGIDFVQVNRFYKFSGDLEDRVVLKDVAKRTQRFTIKSGDKFFEFTRRDSNWRVAMHDGRTAAVSGPTVDAFFAGVEDLEWESALDKPSDKPPAATMLFHDGKAAEPFHRLDVIDGIPGAEGSPVAVILTIDGEGFTVTREEYDGFDRPLKKLIVELAQSIDQAPTKK